MSYSVLPVFSSRTAVPNLFGTRDRFHGRHFVHWGGGDGSGGNASGGSGGNVSDGEWEMKLRSLTHCSPPAVWPGS